ncbi:hypothetical protein NXH67_14020 [Butyrivibrio sp. DSM 10294]|uniref:hypothetical protein n=1 Tax=Butyrivibrio sp. DSM 10294 TaxID=2972457 RepID=UPI00234F46CA|nr:hypothetical protein [Butyrivibrio sp. DSM 10294]MDC7294631.1 hypothetical protein [Butyrivibrio sp. DSM 10294]
MLKKIMEKHLFRVIAIIVLLCVGSVGYVTAKTRDAWSFSDEEAAYREELWNSGITDPYEIARLCSEKFPENYYNSWDENEEVFEKLEAGGADLPLDHYHSDSSTASAPTTSSEVAPSTSNTEKSESKAATKTETKPAKVYAHDFDAITDEAKDNFIHFSEDGTPDSMYLNIRAESAMNTITGRELNATTSGNEVGSINYVDAEGNVLHSWVFENWKSDDDFYLDLSAYLEPYASEELVAAYKLSLQDATLPEGNTVILKVQSPYADDTVVNIFTEETGELKETGKTLTVADGCITFEFTDAISTPVISPETLVEKSAESVDEAKDAVAAEAAPAEEVNEAVLEVETPDPALSTNTETVQNNNTKYIIGIICAVLVLAVGVFAVNNKRRKKDA